jgi:hypothetical protein
LRKNTFPEHKLGRADPDRDDAAAATADLLRRWLNRELQADAAQWLDAEIDRQRNAVDERRLGMALGLVGRRIGRVELSSSADDVAAAQALHARWRPDMWGTDEAARVALLLATWSGDEAAFVARIDRLCATGELTEHVACLKGFAVFPVPASLLSRARARAAVRASMQPPFEAIACYNPYPADHFDEAVYNQMVVKCVFSGASIETIVGLDERRNAELVRMMRDLVSERRAAGRLLPDAVRRFIEN